MTAFKDPTINVVVEKPDAELLAMFCEQPGPKRFLRFAGKEGAEVTAEMQGAAFRGGSATGVKRPVKSRLVLNGDDAPPAIE
jgi:hypothetical protein